MKNWKKAVQILLFASALLLFGCGSEEVDQTNSDSPLPGLSQNSIENTETISIANMSGEDLETLSLNFSESSVLGQNILGEDGLKDGALFDYAPADIQSLKDTQNLRIQIIATSKRGETIDFGTIPVIEPVGMVVILDQTKDGYSMYIK